MNRKIIQIYTVETLQLFTLCLWTMLQHVKVGHIALSQMVIFIFGLKRGHLIYLGPCVLYRVRVHTVFCIYKKISRIQQTSFFSLFTRGCAQVYRVLHTQVHMYTYVLAASNT